MGLLNFSLKQGKCIKHWLMRVKILMAFLLDHRKCNFVWCGVITATSCSLVWRLWCERSNSNLPVANIF